MEKVVRTVYGSALQTAMFLGVPHEIKDHSTLNELFGIQVGVLPLDTVYPRVQFFHIGNGGHRYVTGADTIPYAKSVPHRPKDAGLYKPTPFVLRAVNQDLTPVERAKYALRRTEIHNGDSYFAYYLKRIDVDNVNIAMQNRVVEDGVVTSTDFEPTPGDLTPTPPDISNVGSNDLTAEYMTVSALLSIGLTQNDCTELLNVALIMRGDDNYAIISEIGLCSGVDKVISLPDLSNFKEAIAVQIVSHVEAMHQVKFTASGITGVFDVGTNEPLLNVAP